MVGAVIIKAGLVVGEGFHPGAGHPHAEVFALRQAGDHARGATLYVNLEPCNHFDGLPPALKRSSKQG
jgi:diaminohydroxyphosphoribosylaminopyrimidine deaminase/5-amino-6-(5-phosphoribosylamino)uracil reductase